jgi:hypothetical protein
MADSYLCTDGQPIAVSSSFKGHNTLAQEAENRDPRFSQTIFTPAAPWQISADGTVKTFQEVYSKLYSNSTYSSGTGQNQSV